MYYRFKLTADQEPALRHIVVEDISDEKAVTLVDDPSPKFENHEWVAETPAINADDARMKWMWQITGSLRVYHFTLTRNDGHIIAFNHVTMFPAQLKALARNRWGERY